MMRMYKAAAIAQSPSGGMSRSRLHTGVPFAALDEKKYTSYHSMDNVGRSQESGKENVLEV
jgi:hypothetical protein